MKIKFEYFNHKRGSTGVKALVFALGGAYVIKFELDKRINLCYLVCSPGRTKFFNLHGSLSRV